MKLTEEKIDGRIAYEGKVVKLRVDNVLLENGQTVVREFIENRNACGVVAVDEDENILFVQQYRYAIGKITTELPAGKLDDGETPEEGCRRELLEETGYTAEKLEYIGSFNPSVAYLTETLHLFYATGLRQGKQNLDDDEFINVKKIPKKQALKMVIDGEILDSKTQIAILKSAVLGKI